MEWDWGDGTAKTLNQNVSTATHSYATSGTYTVTATLKRSNTAMLPGLTLAVAKAVVTVGLPVWKFTSMTVAISRSGPRTSPLSVFRADSQHFTRMRDGLSEGGIYVVERDTTRVCTNCGQQTLTRGLYLVEGVSLTLSALTAGPVVALLSQVINYGLLPAPGVKGWPVAGTAKLPVAVPCTRDGDPGEFWTQTGDLVTGRVTGKTVHRCQGGFDDQNAVLPMYATQIMAVDVTFAGDVASGTITGNYMATDGSFDRAQLVVTFQARRVSQ